MGLDRITTLAVWDILFGSRGGGRGWLAGFLLNVDRIGLSVDIILI